MMNIRILMTNLFILGTISSFAQERKTVNAKLNEVTVFFEGAELTHNASTPLNKGDNDIWIDKLSPNVDLNSLKIKTSNGVIVSAHEFSIDYLTKTTSSDINKKLEDSIKIYQKELRQIAVNRTTNENLQDLLQANKSIGGTQTGLKVDELVKMMTYYKTESTTLQTEQSNYEEQTEKINKSIAKLKAQLQQESTKNNKVSGILKLHLMAPSTTTCNLTISYYTNQANWVPYYDINVKSTEQAINIRSKAYISQTTGLNWEKVKLSLSTSSPSFGKTAPVFDTWFLNYQQNRVADYTSFAMDMPKQKSDAMYIRGIATPDTTSSPLVVINGRISSKNALNQIDPNSIANFKVLKGASATALYGSSAINGAILVTLKKMEDHVLSAANDLNMTYNIDLPYTIPGNGKKQAVDLKSQDVAATFKYYSAPKLDTETYLLAEISDWQKLNLLSGKANITYAGVYVGETVINTSSTQNILDLTLGNDKRVSVKREKLQDFSSSKFLGSDTKQVFAYQLTVKNNQNKAIQMKLQDQYPKSTQKDIEVELMKDTTPPSLNDSKKGILSWDFKLKAGETKTFKVLYSVKYPKDKTLNL